MALEKGFGQYRWKPGAEILQNAPGFMLKQRHVRGMRGHLSMSEAMVNDRKSKAELGAHVGGESSSLDSVQLNCNTRYRSWGYLNRDTGEMIPFRCKSWRCLTCGPRKARRLRNQVGVWAEAKQLTRLMTLTLDPQQVQGDVYAHLSDVWRKFRVYLHRTYGRVSFIWVMELQRNGNPHLHVLVDRFIPQQGASRTWDAAGGGRIVDVRYVDVHRVRAYLAKYLTKPWHQMDIPARKRRCSASQDICLSRSPDEDLEGASDSAWVLFAGRGFVISRQEYQRRWEAYQRGLERPRGPT